jgi:hypothetical protein
MKSQTLLQDMIEIARGNKKPEETTSFSRQIPDEFTFRKIGIPTILDWLFVQDFVGDTEVTEIDMSFSDKEIIDLVNETPELQKYFQIKNGTLAFANGLKDEDALEMIHYVKQNYRPEVNF